MNTLTKLNSIQKLLIVIFGMIIVIAIVALFAYMDTFAEGNLWKFGSKEDFGVFGDFVGGVLNPLFAFFTVILLVYSIQVQIEELSKSTKALQASQSAHERQVEISKKELSVTENAHLT